MLGVKDGRSYCGDGLSHVLDFKVNEVGVGEAGSDGKLSQLDLEGPGKVKVTFDAAALLAETPNEETERIRNKRLDEKPYWHLERARIDDTRTVPVEVIVNGYPAAVENIVADGSVNTMEFEIDVDHSSWVAVRILPSVHTNPVFVEVGGDPIRASRRSAKWCAEAVDVCWNAKKGRINADDREAAKKAYDEAKRQYEAILAESVAD